MYKNTYVHGLDHKVTKSKHPLYMRDSYKSGMKVVKGYNELPSVGLGSAGPTGWILQ